MRRAANRMRLRIENLVQELHRQAARFLIDSFDLILLPGFETSEMVERRRRRIRSKTVRNLLSLAHYRFKIFIRHKADEVGAIVLDVNEAYTTKTVSWTGELLEGLGGASVVVEHDGERMDRDYNGARGIYLCALGDIPALRASLLGCAASANDSCLSGNMSARNDLRGAGMLQNDYPVPAKYDARKRGLRPQQDSTSITQIKRCIRTRTISKVLCEWLRVIIGSGSALCPEDWPARPEATAATVGAAAAQDDSCDSSFRQAIRAPQAPSRFWCISRALTATSSAHGSAPPATERPCGSS